MTKLRIVGVSMWERVWLENSLSQLEGGWQGRGWVRLQSRFERVTTHMEVEGGYVKEIWLVSGRAMG